MVAKAICMRNGDVYIVDSYDTSSTGAVTKYWCLPLGMKYKTEMDVEAQSYVPISYFDPQILLTFDDKCLFNVVEQIKKTLSNVGNETEITDSFLVSFLNVDYTFHSLLMETLINVLFKKNCYVCIDERDDESFYFTRLKD